MKIAIPIDADGNVDPRWGRARYVAIAETDPLHRLAGFSTHLVRWDELHDAGTHGAHHARIVRFLREQEADAVAAAHLGPGIARSIDKMGLVVLTGAAGDARSLAQAAAPKIAAEIERRAAAGPDGIATRTAQATQASQSEQSANGGFARGSLPIVP